MLSPAWLSVLERPSGKAGSIVWPVLLTVFIAYGIYSYIQKRAQYKADMDFGRQKGCLPVETKVPHKWPLALDVLKLQYDALLAHRVLAFQSEYLEKMPTTEISVFGTPGYLTTSPTNLESMLSSRFEDWGLGSRRGGLYPLLGEGIFTQDGRPWKHSREMLRHQFARMNFRNLSIFDEHVNTLIAHLSSCNNIVDLQPAFFRFTLATTTALIFGESVENFPNEEHNAFGSCFDYASMISAIRLRLTDFHFLYAPKKFIRACDTVKRYADHFVQEALKNMDDHQIETTSEKNKLILDLYRELKDPVLVRDQLINVLIAGRDTTACAMSWAFFLLVRHPVTLEKLRAEIRDSVPEGQQVTRAHIQQMLYLKCVLNETLRLYPSLPLNVRVARQTTLLPSGGGPDGTSPVLIRKGTSVGYSIYQMHRQKSLYGPDAKEFRPERWEGSELEGIGWGFLPFHGGPRVCLGKEFALAEASYAIVKIIQTFPNLRIPTGQPIEPIGQEKQSLGIVLSSTEGCKVLLT